MRHCRTGLHLLNNELVKASKAPGVLDNLPEYTYSRKSPGVLVAALAILVRNIRERSPPLPEEWDQRSMNFGNDDYLKVDNHILANGAITSTVLNFCNWPSTNRKGNDGKVAHCAWLHLHDVVDQRTSLLKNPSIWHVRRDLLSVIQGATGLGETYQFQDGIRDKPRAKKDDMIYDKPFGDASAEHQVNVVQADKTRSRFEGQIEKIERSIQDLVGFHATMNAETISMPKQIFESWVGLKRFLLF